MSELLVKTAEFILSDQLPVRYRRTWLNYEKEGQAFLAAVYSANHEDKLPINERPYQICCRCNAKETIPMTIRRNPEKKGSAAKYTLITVSGSATLHDDRCENHMANSEDEDKGRDIPPDKTPVRPKIYGADQHVALDTRGCTQFASGGERTPSGHEGKGAGKRTSTEPLPAKWGKTIIGAAYYNVTRRGLPQKAHPFMASLFREIVMKAPKWTFGEREPLKDRMFTPYLKNAKREDLTTRMLSKLSHLQKSGPGKESLFVLGVFGQTHSGEVDALEVRFPVIGVRDPKQWPFVLLPMEREIFSNAQAAALKRDVNGLWHYAAAILGYKDNQPCITALALLPYHSGSGAIVSTFRERQLAELFISNNVPFQQPLPFHKSIIKAWGSKPPEFILLDQCGMEKAFVVVYGDRYHYDEEAYQKWDQFYRERAEEWGLDYLQWSTYQNPRIPETLAAYRPAIPE